MIGKVSLSLDLVVICPGINAGQQQFLYCVAWRWRWPPAIGWRRATAQWRRPILWCTTRYTVVITTRNQTINPPKGIGSRQMSCNIQPTPGKARWIGSIHGQDEQDLEQGENEAMARRLLGDGCYLDAGRQIRGVERARLLQRRRQLPRRAVVGDRRRHAAHRRWILVGSPSSRSSSPRARVWGRG